MPTTSQVQLRPRSVATKKEYLLLAAAIMVFASGLWLHAAHAAPVNYSNDMTVSLTSPAAYNFLIKAGAVADSVAVNATSVIVGMSATTGGNFVLTASTTALTVTGSGSTSGGTVTQTCTSGLAKVTIEQVMGSVTYTITPTGTQCVAPVIATVGGGTGGIAPSGGGGGGGVTPTTTPTTTTASTLTTTTVVAATSTLPAPVIATTTVVVSPTVTVSGVVRIAGGASTDALIWLWSDKGGSVSIRASQDGRFAVSLTRNDRWHIGANKDINGFSYEYTDGFSILADTVDFSINPVLVKINKEPLPPPVSVTKPATEPIVVAAQDGASVRIPAGAAASGGTITATIRPTSEAPSQLSAFVAGTVYDVTLQDQAGQSIKDLAKTIELTFPYNDKNLKEAGATEDTIYPSYFDETKSTWVRIDDFTRDKVKKVLVVRINHLTRFAIVAAADTTPPHAPTRVSAKVVNRRNVELSWVNPAKDFHHAKVFRSEKSGDPGKIIANDLTVQKYSDTGIAGGKAYYYVVRAVDPAGNESANSGQAVVRVAAAVKLPKFTKNLATGSAGSEVKNLQLFLIDTNAGPAARALAANGASTYFGPLTKKALMEFQKSAGLIPANGSFGLPTRTYINQTLNR